MASCFRINDAPLRHVPFSFRGRFARRLRLSYTHSSRSAMCGGGGLNKEPQLKKSTPLGTVVLVLAVAACLALAGCNTVEGAGKDIEKAGEGIQNAAD